jgi:hypothetical protein
LLRLVHVEIKLVLYWILVNWLVNYHHWLLVLDKLNWRTWFNYVRHILHVFNLFRLLFFNNKVAYYLFTKCYILELHLELSLILTSKNWCLKCDLSFILITCRYILSNRNRFELQVSISHCKERVSRYDLEPCIFQKKWLSNLNIWLNSIVIAKALANKDGVKWDLLHFFLW